MLKTSKYILFSKQLILFALILISLLSLALITLLCTSSSSLFTPTTSKAQSSTSIDSDFEVTVVEMLELSLTNCDATSSSVVVVDVVPSTAGTFKSACQTASVNTNAPGYTLTAKTGSSTLNYQNPTTITPTPTILSTTHSTAIPGTLANDTWGFAVENRLNFDVSYGLDSATNAYAQLPTIDTTIYASTGVFPMPVTSHKFYFATRLTPATMSGTYMTTITYTAIGEAPVETMQFWQVSGRDILNPYGEVTLLKGFNVGDNASVWYDYYQPSLSLVSISHNDFTYSELKSIGANVVRFDLPARLFADSCTTPSCLYYDNVEDVFEIIDDALTHAANHEVGVILNIHNSYGTSNIYENGDITSKWETFLPENIEKTTALWEQIATRFKDDKRVLGYDLMNEPAVKLESYENINDAIAKWDEAAQGMIDAIRAIDKNHMIIVERVNRGLKDNGNTSIFPSLSEYVFPNVSDPQNNIMYEFHDYGNWAYATQTDTRINADPWVWPNESFLGVIPNTGLSSYMNEIWPPAMFSVNNGDLQDTWVTLESNNGNPINVSSEYNVGMVAVEVGGNLNNDSVIYVDDIVVEEYDTNNNFLRTVFERTYRVSENINRTSNTSIELSNTSVCYDNDGGCVKIVGPSSGYVLASSDMSDLYMFRIDNTKKYKISAKLYGENLPSGVVARIMLMYTHATDQQARPYNKSYLNEQLQRYVNYSIENNVPIYNGEYGVLKNEAVWSAIGAEQFINDSMEVYKENYINSSYFSYYSRSGQSWLSDGLRVRDGNLSANLPVTADNTTLNTTLYDIFLRHK